MTLSPKNMLTGKEKIVDLSKHFKAKELNQFKEKVYCL